jgi:HlyD family secretion protein
VLTRTAGERTAAGAAAPRAHGRPARVYRLENGNPVAVNVRVGISDGQRTEVIDGLAEGDQVITGDASSGAPAARPQGGRRGPF